MILNKNLQKVAKETEEIGEIGEIGEIEILVKDQAQEVLQKRKKRKNHVLNKKRD